MIFEAVARWDMDQFSTQLLNGRPPYPYSDDELRKVAPLRRAKPARLDSSELFWQRFHVVSMIDTNTNTVAGTVPVGNAPYGVAITADGTKIYVTNALDDTVSVVNTATNLVIAHYTCGGRTPGCCSHNSNSPKINAVPEPYGLAVTPDGGRASVTNNHTNTASVINTSTNAITATVPAGNQHSGSHTGRHQGVRRGLELGSVISMASDTVIATIPIPSSPDLFGIFIESSRPESPAPTNTTGSLANTSTYLPADWCRGPGRRLREPA